MANQTLSDEEFHRMQLQLIEMRTENYKLKDENKKFILRLKEHSVHEAKLDKELNKQIKMKKALSTLNKSKQAQEYEALLQQTEQEFALQSQTLMSELSKLSTAVEKLEKENQQLKRESGDSTANSESSAEIRRLLAENKALKKSIKNIEQKYEKELESRLTNPDPLGVMESSFGNTNVENNQQSNENTTESIPSPSHASSCSDEGIEGKIIHLQAQCERMKMQLSQFEETKVNLEIEKEEKAMLEKALEEERTRFSREQRALTGEVEAFREKLERKQGMYLKLHEDKEKLIAESENNAATISSLKEFSSKDKQEVEKRLHAEMSSLKSALQSAHHMVDKYQTNEVALQKKISVMEEGNLHLKEDINKLKQTLHMFQEKEKNQNLESSELSSHQRALEDQVKQLKSQQMRQTMERDDAVAKFEESARASEALLLRINESEQANEALRREVAELQELAEKRKRVMDKQAVESQENSARFSEQLNAMRIEHEDALMQSREGTEKKIKILESTCKKQEQELIRINHQDRAKTRELDSSQQQIKDLQATVTSLEGSRGWFERALHDAEKVAAAKLQDHEQELNRIREECQHEIEQVKARLLANDDVVVECQQDVDRANEEVSKRDETIEMLRQEIKDEVSKQRLVEKKGHATLKDLKRQLANEKKRNERLQETLNQLSSNHAHLDELIHASEDKDGDGSSTSSFSFRDLLSSKTIPSDSPSPGGSTVGHSSRKSFQPTPSPPISKGETKELLTRITSLQQDKWQLEEQVRHLEESAGAMAAELLEKSKLLQGYIQHTRSDYQKSRSSNEELGGSRKFSDRMKSIITGQQDSDVANIRELNRKLTRMLEEEMTKNMALKQDLASLAEVPPSNE